MIVYFVRHGETEMCKKGIIKGYKDSPLTLRGRDSAEKLGQLLEKENNIEIIYTSDLGRCVEMSEIINKVLKLEIVKSKELRERNFGLLNGKSIKEVEKAIQGVDPNIGMIPVRVNLISKAVAKSHRPESLFTDKTCPIIGAGKLGE